MVLQGVSLALAAGTHVGVVGRTGAGKSTFLELTGPATFYRTFAYYNTSVFDHVTKDDAYAEATWQADNKTLTFRLVAGKRGKLREHICWLTANLSRGQRSRITMST